MSLPINSISSVNCSPKLLSYTKKIIQDPESHLKLLKEIFVNIYKEEVWLLCNDFKQCSVSVFQLALGSINHASFSLLDIAFTVSMTGACSVILAHNHINDSPLPSESDIQITNYLNILCGSLGVSLEDHIIMANNRYFSFKHNGFLK